MPNYCFNRIRLNVTQEELERIKEKVMSKDEFEDEYFDFNKVIKRPRNILLRAFKTNTLEAFSKYYYENPDKLEQKILDEIIKNKILKVRIDGKLVNIDRYVDEKYSSEELKDYNGEMLILWYDWCTENWGTKWNSLFSSINKDELIFSTAWNPISLELFESFINICKEVIGDKANNIWLYYEECGIGIFGRYFIQDGELYYDEDYREEVA
ncbi:hypothetical protein NON08_14860 [Cetobacterium somerae]|uniref:hypothetical protein n=1 Tax=Cetobacterium sp. NK01 TaxID=2993530 RepID=UPI0021162D85|nr:hypothetical protein [Cetobacterium sp. NK01]MCQ8213780.1 hypothetical protein [Cetobacterium sp. NK01]